MTKIGIYIFRRDLRLEDNIGLLNLIKEVDIVLPIFILDRNQIKKTKHNINDALSKTITWYISKFKNNFFDQKNYGKRIGLIND